jgi:membrane protein YdbS with pleckstrin-like domain
MHIEKLLLFFGFFSTILRLIRKWTRWLMEYIDDTYYPLNPKVWKQHNRIAGWTRVILSLLFGAMVWYNFLNDSNFFFKAVNLICAMFAMIFAGAFALLQYKIWRRGDYYGRAVKMRILDGII